MKIKHLTEFTVDIEQQRLVSFFVSLDKNKSDSKETVGAPTLNSTTSPSKDPSDKAKDVTTKPSVNGSDLPKVPAAQDSKIDLLALKNKLKKVRIWEVPGCEMCSILLQNSFTGFMHQLAKNTFI